MTRAGLAGIVLDEMQPAIGSQLGPYTIEEVVGAGGMGDVYRARMENYDISADGQTVVFLVADATGRSPSGWQRSTGARRPDA